MKDFKDQIASDVVSIIVTCVRAAGKMLVSENWKCNDTKANMAA